MEIIFLALITGYLLYRLWMVLGQETEEDHHRRDKKMSPIEEETNVVQLPFKSAPSEPSLIESSLKPGVRIGLEAVKKEDPAFNFEHFLKGAKAAYEIILNAFAKGDKETLKQLLNRKVFAQFEAAIEDRLNQNQHLEIHVENFERVDVDSVELNDRQITIAVRFKTSQTRFTTDTTGTVLDNPAKISTFITDIWTFTHHLEAKESTWYLAATRTETTPY